MKYIFEFKKLDLGDIARSFFLFKMPKLKGIKIEKINFDEDDINIEDIKFKDKN